MSIIERLMSKSKFQISNQAQMTKCQNDAVIHLDFALPFRSLGEGGGFGFDLKFEIWILTFSRTQSCHLPLKYASM